MLSTQLQRNLSPNGTNYDREKELKAFDETKAGVKGLVDVGIVKVPPIFVIPSYACLHEKSSPSPVHFQIPVIDLQEVHKDGIRHKQIIEQVRQASEVCGLFQVVNHGISSDVMGEMIEGVHRFHEQPKELKMEYYSRDNVKKVRFNSNFDLYQSTVANWRDTLYLHMAPDAPDPKEFAAACRDIPIKYMAHVRELSLTLFELLSEGLGLKPSHLIGIECDKVQSLVCHYYPACPEPNLTLGGSPHKDPAILTILLQDHIGGLQVLHQNQWVDVPPIPGAFVVILGDLLQLLSNDKYKSAEHRVLANHIGPRVSVAGFFTTYPYPLNRLYGPIKELLSDENPPLYREIMDADYTAHYNSRPLGGFTSVLDLLRL